MFSFVEGFTKTADYLQRIKSANVINKGNFCAKMFVTKCNCIVNHLFL